MLGYILGITKWGNKGIPNRESVKGFKSEQKNYKSGQRNFKSGQRLQIGAREITNWSRDFKLGQRLQVGAEHVKQRQYGSFSVNLSRGNKCSM